MSKIKNGGLDQYGAEPFEQQQLGTAGVEGVNVSVYWRHRWWSSRFCRLWAMMWSLPRAVPDSERSLQFRSTWSWSRCCLLLQWRSRLTAVSRMSDRYVYTTRPTFLVGPVRRLPAYYVQLSIFIARRNYMYMTYIFDSNIWMHRHNSMDFGKCDNSNSGTHFGKHKRLIVNILQLYSPSYLAANKKE